MGAEALPTTPLEEATDRIAEGVLMELKADAEAARERMAIDNFIFVYIVINYESMGEEAVCGWHFSKSSLNLMTRSRLNFDFGDETRAI